MITNIILSSLHTGLLPISICTDLFHIFEIFVAKT